VPLCGKIGVHSWLEINPLIRPVLVLYCPRNAKEYVHSVYLQIAVPLQHFIMNATINIESPWKTYPKTALAVLPALAAWWFTLIFLIPRLREIWDRASFDDATAFGIVDVFVGWKEHVFIVALAALVVLGLLEWRSATWRRYRRPVMYSIVFLFNTAILFFLTATLTYGLMAVSH